MDSGGSGNGSNHLLNTDLSVANSSINMWNVSSQPTYRADTF